MELIHFGKWDERSCLYDAPRIWTGRPRRVTLDPNEVTCETCKGNDTFVLSPEAAAYVSELEKQYK